MPAAGIQLNNYDLFEKAQLKVNPLIENRVQQDYLAESYARHLPSNQKDHKTVTPTRCGLSDLPLNLYGKPWWWEKSYPTAKNLPISPIWKIPLNRFKASTIKSLISSPSNSNFQVITLCNLHLQLQSFLLYHILNFRLSVHTCHANLTNNFYWMLPSAWQKHWMIEALPSKISISSTFPFPPYLQCYFKTLVLLLLVFLFFKLPFLFQTL